MSLEREDSVFSYDELPLVTPSNTTTYIVKVVDFKFDHSTDSVTVKVVDCAEPTRLVVYPNPCFEKFNISYNSPIPEEMNIQIFDLTGILLKSESFEQNYESKELQLDIKNYPSGLYFIRLF